ncbi:hypothetical protein LUX09_33710 [Streptomyces albogriseolus]|nr:hypothetical protein [Streptomyces albogriseolus]
MFATGLVSMYRTTALSRRTVSNAAYGPSRSRLRVPRTSAQRARASSAKSVAVRFATLDHRDCA